MHAVNIMRHWLHTRFLVTLVLGVTAVFAPAHSQTPKTASLADITAILDSEAPDPTRIADLRAKAAATPGTLSKGELARFFHSRSQTKLALGDYRGAIADCEQAVEAAKTGLPLPEYAPILQSLALQYGYMGELKQSLDIWLRMQGDGLTGHKGPPVQCQSQHCPAVYCVRRSEAGANLRRTQQCAAC